MGSDILGNAVSPDVNTFPSDLIERVDVVTGGNSAVYGSDAIAGVVNFILKKDFTGLQFRGQGGQSFDSDAGDYYASVLAGTNFWDDHGNIAVELRVRQAGTVLRLGPRRISRTRACSSSPTPIRPTRSMAPMEFRIASTIRTSGRDLLERR